MPVFTKLPFDGVVRFLGVVKNRDDDLKSNSIDSVQLTYSGFDGEDHGGLTRASCSRVSMLYPKGTEIANARQVSIMSVEELSDMQQAGGLSDNKPEWWGANLVLEGIPELSALPPSSRIQFPSGGTIRVDVENGPCRFTAEEVSKQTGAEAKIVLNVAKDKRGLVGSIEREGQIAVDDVVTVFVPNARPYRYLDGD